MTPNDQTDPLDDILHHAFAAEIDAEQGFDITDRLLRKIAREQRIRGLSLGAVLVVGLTLAIGAALPLLQELTSLLTLPEAAATSLTTTATATAATPMVLLVLLAPWLFAVVDDPI